MNLFKDFGNIFFQDIPGNGGNFPGEIKFNSFRCHKNAVTVGYAWLQRCTKSSRILVLQHKIQTAEFRLQIVGNISTQETVAEKCSSETLIFNFFLIFNL